MDLQCPLMKGPCIQRMCRWWISLQGQNPQDGSVYDRWGCTIEFIPILLVGLGKDQRSTGQSVEDFKRDLNTGIAKMLEEAELRRLT